MATYKQPPMTCNLCSAPIAEKLVDGKTTLGPWADMCPACHEEYGAGLGTGRGQLYEKQPDGRYMKVEG